MEKVVEPDYEDFPDIETERPKIDLGDLETLAATQCTNQEIASYFGVDLELLLEFYEDKIIQGRARGMVDLRQQQFKKAQAGEKEALAQLLSQGGRHKA